MATIKVRDDSPHLVLHLKPEIWQTGNKNENLHHDD